jgi:predicted nucleotide-binding protein
MFFHVYIELEDDGDHTENDFSEEELQHKVIEPYERGERFLVAGTPVDPLKIKKIQISETELSSKELIPKIRYENSRSGIVAMISDEYEVFSKGNNITRKLILGPAGFKKEPSTTKEDGIKGKKIFIVHGIDDISKLELYRMLRGMNFEPIILHEQPSMGKTIIEKLEYYGKEAGYAFVLLSPDDLGGLKQDLVVLQKIDEIKEKLNERARQNVIFEMGWFQGKIGRDRVCIIYPVEMELPTDIDGMVYIGYNYSIRECYADIIKELRAVKYEPKI